MTYNPKEPQDLPPPVIATTQMRTNFATIQTVFSNNHSAINTSNQGKHDKVIFEQQATDPVITSDYISLYSKSVITASSTQPQLFLKIPKFLPNNQENLPQQLTFNKVTFDPGNVNGPQYQTFLPGGYIKYFGSVSSVPITITLAPACTRIACVVVQANNILIAVGGNSPVRSRATINSANTFTIDANTAGLISPVTLRINWTVIGIQ